MFDILKPGASGAANDRILSQASGDRGDPAFDQSHLKSK
jgi:hypothetical protein